MKMKSIINRHKHKYECNNGFTIVTLIFMRLDRGSYFPELTTD